MKSLEFYIAVIGASLFVFEINKDKTFLSRFTITIASAGFGLSLAPEVSKYVFGSVNLTALLITALGFLVLEVLSAIISDIDFIKKIIEKRTGGSNANGSNDN